MLTTPRPIKYCKISSKRPNGHWYNHDNGKNFLDDLNKQQNISTLNKKKLLDHGDGGTLPNYQGLAGTSLESVYISHNIMKPTHRSITNRRFQRTFLDWLGRKLMFKDMEDWYRITNKQIIENGGKVLLDKYRNSPSRMIRSVYSEYPWKNKFKGRTSENYWDIKENRINLVNRLAKQLHIGEAEDWYRISLMQIGEINRCMSVFNKYPLEKLLLETYPTIEWNLAELQFKKGTKSAQWWLQVLVKQLFPQSGNFNCLSLIF
jgi:hypothetical protein